MLTNTQKKYLNKQANPIKPIYQIGKEGISQNLITGISEALEVHELIKVKLLETCPVDTNEAVIVISAGCKCEVVNVIGRTIILYRKSKKKIYRLP